jgi:hypothetical protein
MPSPLQQRLFLLSKSKVIQPTVLVISARVEVLFIEGKPWALYDGEILFPDLPRSTPRSLVEMIHKFWGRDTPQTRLPPEEFDYVLVSAMSRSLRPLLRRLPNGNDAGTTEQRSENAPSAGEDDSGSAARP